MVNESKITDVCCGLAGCGFQRMLLFGVTRVCFQPWCGVRISSNLHVGCLRYVSEESSSLAGDGGSVLLPTSWFSPHVQSVHVLRDEAHRKPTRNCALRCVRALSRIHRANELL